jgi:hypothetical protein
MANAYGIQVSLRVAVAACSPMAYQFYFFCFAGLAVAARAAYEKPPGTAIRVMNRNHDRVALCEVRDRLPYQARTPGRELAANLDRDRYELHLGLLPPDRGEPQ